MAIDATSPRSRRAILGAAAGGAGALALSALGQARPVAAADPNDVVLGTANSATAATSVKNTTDDATAVSFAGQHDTSGTGLSGSSATGTGVIGASLDATPTTDWDVTSHKNGVFGTAGSASAASTNTDEAGVYGFAGLSQYSCGVWGESATGQGVYGYGPTGVYGDGYWGVYGTGNVGVVGDVAADGVGVYGFVGDSSIPEPTYGVGVYARAETTAQIALQVVGKAKFSRSGRTSLGSTATSKKITMAGVSTSSYIIATMQTNVSGLYVRAVVPASGYFTIYLSKAGGKTVYVGYLVIN